MSEMIRHSTDLAKPDPKDFGVRVEGKAFKQAWLKTLDKATGLRNSYTPPRGMWEYVEIARRWFAQEVARPLRRELLYTSVHRKFTVVETPNG